MADSVCEAEYVAASDAVKKVVWLRKFLTELEVAPSLVGPVLLYCDSSGAIAQTKEPKGTPMNEAYSTPLPSHPKNCGSR